MRRRQAQTGWWMQDVDYQAQLALGFFMPAKKFGHFNPAARSHFSGFSGQSWSPGWSIKSSPRSLIFYSTENTYE